MKKIALLTLALMTLTGTLSACPGCRAQVAAVLQGPDLGLHVLLVLLPLLVLAVMAVGFYYSDDLKIKKRGL